MYDLRTHPEADKELAEALGYLAERTLWHANRFADTYHAALRRLHKQPECRHFVWRDFRRFNISPYPYGIIYRLRNEEVFIVALMHEKRHPDYWKSRIDD